MPQRGDTLRLLQIVRATKDETLSDCEKLSVVSYSMLASTTLEANKSISYNQTFIPVQGSMVLVVAPAPDRQSTDPRTYAFDYDHAAAFVIEPGQVAFIDKGVWHSLVPVGAACTFINVTRKNAQEPATAEGNEARMERIHAARPYVEYVDLQARDDRVLALEW
jgi:ureidoglycolate hydrolase